MKDFKVYLVSGNKRKAEEFLRILDGKLNIELVDIDLPEIQGSPEEITIYKCKSAYERINGPVFVEDTSLCFNAYNGLPGPYVKWFLKSVGAQGLFNMLQGYQDKSAYAMTLIGYFDGSSMSEPIIFQGRIDGEIVKPSGEKGFSWDPIFKPNGYNATDRFPTRSKSRLEQGCVSLRGSENRRSLWVAPGRSQPQQLPQSALQCQTES
ncbi:hypothetical protein OIY81_2499 [Cryptosporidium canis]|nr:hypothetical protein OIY81_2499 [Cryptosporidium canis]